MSEQDYRRRDEKEEKEEKPGQGREQTREEKWTRDPLGGLIWGLIIILAGLTLVAANLGTFPWLTWDNAWALIFIGAGLIFLLEVVIRLIMPAYRRPLAGRLVLVFVALGLGLGGFIGFELTWPLIIVGIGVAIVVGAFLRPRF